MKNYTEENLLNELSSWNKENDCMICEIPYDNEDEKQIITDVVNKFAIDYPNYYICNEKNNHNIIRICKQQHQ